MKNRIKIAGLQVGSFEGTYTDNLNKIISSVKEIVEKESPELIVCSELMTAPYFAAVPQTDDSYFDFAESIEGQTVNTFIELSKELNVHLVGTYFEKAEENNEINYYNSAFLCSPTKGIIGNYRKVHIPKINVDSIITDEKYYFEQFGGGGKEFPIFTLDNGWRVGMLICFDRTFPESWRSLTLQGVDLILVPTATYGFRKDLYVEEFRVRALENNVYVLGVNKAGAEQLPGEELERYNFGLSCIIDPLGNKIAVASENEWEYVSAEIDYKLIENSKDRVDWLKERKGEFYSESKVLVK